MRLRHRAALYFYASTLSRVGDEASVPALLLFGLALSGSPRVAAWSYAALTLAAAVGGPVLGVFLDRSTRPGAALGACLLLYGSGLVTITLAGAALPAPMLLAVAAVTGLFGPAVSGGWSSQLAHVLPGQPRAFSLDVGTYNVAGMTGPALAAVTATTVGPACAMCVAAVLIVAAAPAAWLLPQPATAVRQNRPSLLRSLGVDLRAGLRPVVHIPTLRGATAGSTVSFAGIGMLVVACPLLGGARFGDPGRGALLITVLAASSLMATLITARWPLPLPPDQVLLITTVLNGVGLALVAVAAAPPVTVLAIAIVGMADGPQLAAVFAIRQRDSPAEHRAQVFTTAASLKIGSAALGAALAGVLASASLVAVLLAAALSQFVAPLTAALCGTPVRGNPGRNGGRPPGWWAASTTQSASGQSGEDE